MAKKSLTNNQRNRIFQLVTEDGFSQSKLAALYDVSQATISNILKDKRHEAEVAELKHAMTNAMAKGVQAVINEGKLSKNVSAFLESK